MTVDAKASVHMEEKQPVKEGIGAMVPQLSIDTKTVSTADNPRGSSPAAIDRGLVA